MTATGHPKPGGATAKPEGAEDPNSKEKQKK